MTGAVAGRAAAAVRSGAVTQAERDTLARKLATAHAAQTPARAAPQPAAATTAAPAPAAPRSAPKPPPRAPQAGPGRRWRAAVETPVNTGAGFLLGLMFWGWIILPLIRGGPPEVRKTIRAKFLNKAPDGSWLP